MTLRAGNHIILSCYPLPNFLPSCQIPHPCSKHFGGQATGRLHQLQQSPKTLCLKLPVQTSHTCLENWAQKYLQSMAMTRPLDFCGHSLNRLFLSLSTLFFPPERMQSPEMTRASPQSLCWHQPRGGHWGLQGHQPPTALSSHRSPALSYSSTTP